MSENSLDQVYEEYMTKNSVFDGLKFTRYVQINHGSKFKYLEISKWLKSRQELNKDGNKKVSKVSKGATKTRKASDENSDANKSGIIDEAIIDVPSVFLDESTQGEAGQGGQGGQGGQDESGSSLSRSNCKYHSLSIGSVDGLAARFEQTGDRPHSSGSGHTYFIPKTQASKNDNDNENEKEKEAEKTSKVKGKQGEEDGKAGMNEIYGEKINNWPKWNENETKLFLKNCVKCGLGKSNNENDSDKYDNYLRKISNNCNLVGSELTQMNDICLKLMGIDDTKDRLKILLLIRDIVFEKTDATIENGMCIVCINKYKQEITTQHDASSKINVGHLNLCQECFSQWQK